MRLSNEQLGLVLGKLGEAVEVVVPNAFKEAALEIGPVFKQNDILKHLPDKWSNAETEWNAKVQPYWDVVQENAKEVKGLIEAMEGYRVSANAEMEKEEEHVVAKGISQGF